VNIVFVLSNNVMSVAKLYHRISEEERYCYHYTTTVQLVRDSSDVRRFFVRLAGDVGALSIRKTADLPHQLWVGTFPRFVAIRFYFLSETLI
jgi:hypothetical protein